jgi:hypothetical protein
VHFLLRLERRVYFQISIKRGYFLSSLLTICFFILSNLHTHQSIVFLSHLVRMRFSSGLFVALSASFVASVPVSSPEEPAAAAALFEKAYSEKRSPEKDAATAGWLDKAYSEKRSPEKDAAAAAAYYFTKAYVEESN